MNQVEIDQFLQLVKDTDAKTKHFLIQQIYAMLPQPSDTETWTDEERKMIINPQPLSGAEIIAAGLTGTWADEDIEDSIEWVNTQEAKRRAKYQW